MPGETKVWQYIALMRRIFIVDCPGVRAKKCLFMHCYIPFMFRDTVRNPRLMYRRTKYAIGMGARHPIWHPWCTCVWWWTCPFPSFRSGRCGRKYRAASSLFTGFPIWESRGVNSSTRIVQQAHWASFFARVCVGLLRVCLVCPVALGIRCL